MNNSSYLPILMFIGIGIAVGLTPILLGRLLGPHKPNTEKLSAYECGFEAFEDSRMQFDIRYYLIAIFFIIFDLETAFLFPWGAAITDIGWTGYLSMLIFLLEFIVGFIYIWKLRALDWE